MNLKKIIMCFISIISSFLICFIMISARQYLFGKMMRYVCIFCTMLLSLSVIFAIFSNRVKTSKTILILNILFAITITLFYILHKNNLLYIFTSVSNFKYFILSTGGTGVFIYILIQMLQIVCLPIPASIIAIAGAVIYGPLLASIYCSIGVLLGSYLSYIIGKVFGFRIICWIVGLDNAKKYTKVLNENSIMFLAVAFLLPMFPDDILCLIAGITNINFSSFFIVTTLFRPIGVICMCFFGTGSIIPFSGWGIPIWIVLILFILLSVIFIYKNQNKIEGWMLKTFGKKKKIGQ